MSSKIYIKEKYINNSNYGSWYCSTKHAHPPSCHYTTISCVMSIRPPARMEQLCSHWTDFHEILRFSMCIFERMHIVYVCVRACVRACVCVRAIHIYTFLLCSGTVLHGLADRYLALCEMKWNNLHIEFTTFCVDCALAVSSNKGKVYSQNSVADWCMSAGKVVCDRKDMRIGPSCESFTHFNNSFFVVWLIIIIIIIIIIVTEQEQSGSCVESLSSLRLH